MAATPILQTYKELRPEDEIVLSVITPGGYEVGSCLVGKCVTDVFYAPFDVPSAVKRAISVIRPSVFVCLETELWPNLLCLIRRSGARLILVNGRISDRSFRSYRRLKTLFRWVLGQFDRILAQTETDADRLREIGGDPERVAIGGNAKFDQAAEKLTPAEVESLRADFRLKPGAPVLVVGSTRQSDEERVVIDAYLEARKVFPDLALIFAPRHVERAGEVVAQMKEAGLQPVRRTEMKDTDGYAEQIVLDTFGELGRVYALADVTFIGNSLTLSGGGQNLLQPLAQGKPVFYGPYMQNFRDIASMAESAGVASRVSDAATLAGMIREILLNGEERAEISRRAVELVQSNRGAAAMYAAAIAELAEASR